MKPSRTILLTILVALPFTAMASVTYDAAAAFSLASNLNDEWQYGTSGITLGGVFSPFANSTSVTFQNAFVGSWYGDESMFGDDFPIIGKNFSNVTQAVSTGAIVLRPMELFAHPGPGGTFSVLRFTVPADGEYTVNGTFEGRDERGVTTDVYVLLNDTPLFSGDVIGFGASSVESYSQVLQLESGDRVDFVVGVGANDNFENDSTGISAIVTPHSTTTGPAHKDQCKDGEWKTFSSPRTFKNQGDCIQFVNTGK